MGQLKTKLIKIRFSVNMIYYFVTAFGKILQLSFAYYRLQDSICFSQQRGKEIFLLKYSML